MMTDTHPGLDRSKPFLDDDQILAKAIARFNRDRRYSGLPPCQQASISASASLEEPGRVGGRPACPFVPHHSN